MAEDMTGSRLRKIFSGVEADRTGFDRLMTRPAPERRFVVYFTPRSGSSWLTDIISQTNVMGRCNEVFNPNFMPSIASACNASNIQDYIAAIQRRLNTNGTFSFEITYHQLNAVFPDKRLFLENFSDLPAIWLIREDIVEQAVSLAKMVTTQVTHSPHSTAEMRHKADSGFRYDAALIKRWLNHILVAERENERFFRQTGIEPLRLSYEKMFKVPTLDLVRILANHAGIPDISEDTVFDIQHEKIGTSRNAAYADRFRKEQGRFLEDIQAERALWLGLLN